MKRIFGLLLMSIFIFNGYIKLNAQEIPQGIKYQAIARELSGQPLTNSYLNVQIGVLKGETEQIIIWEETHYVFTNEFGLFEITIGNGVPTNNGTAVLFQNIDWSQGDLFLKTEIDFGDGYTDMGMVKLLAVPFALVAQKALEAPKPDIRLDELEGIDVTGISANELIKWSGTQWVRGDSIKVACIIVEKGITAFENIETKKKLIAESIEFDYLIMSDGTEITVISNDSTLNNASANALVTEKAVKNYVDNMPISDDQQLGFNSTTNILTLESGGQVDLSGLINDLDADAENEIQSLSIDGDTIYLTNGGTVTLPVFSGSFNDLTDVPANLDLDATDDFSGDYNDLSNKLDTAGWDYDRTDDFSGNYEDLANKPNLSDSTNWNQAYEWGNHTNAGYLTMEVDGSITNEIQTLSINADTIFLSDGGKVTLPVDNDTDATNEIQDLELTGGTLKITNNASATEINLAPFTGTNTDEQTLSFNSGTNELSITNGNLVDLTDLGDDADADPSNELQVLSISNDTIYLTNGGFVKLLPGDWNTIVNIPANIDTDATDDFNGDYNNLTNKPDFTNWDTDVTNDFDGDYNSLTNKLDTTGWDYNRNDDFSGNYNDLSNAPTNVSSFSNDAGYLTVELDGSISNELQSISISNDTIYLSNGGFVKLPAAALADWNTMINIPTNIDTDYTNDFSGNYTDLLGAPDLTDSTNWNDAYEWGNHASSGYLTSEVDGSISNELQTISISNDTIYLSNGGFVKLPSGTVADWNTMVNIPTNIDTDSTDDFSGQYDDLINPPTSLGSFTNDVGYLTAEVDGATDNELISNFWLDVDTLKLTESSTTFKVNLDKYNVVGGSHIIKDDDNDTKVYITNDSIIFETDGTERFRIDSAGPARIADGLTVYGDLYNYGSSMTVTSDAVFYSKLIVDAADPVQVSNDIYAGQVLRAGLNLTLSDHSSTPVSALSNYGKLYVVNKKLYFMDEDGLETNLLNFASTDLSEGYLFIGNASGLATPTQLTGDGEIKTDGSLEIYSLKGRNIEDQEGISARPGVYVGDDSQFMITKPTHSSGAATSLMIHGQDAGGLGDDNGGDVIIKPGKATGSGQDGKVEIDGNVKVKGYITGDDNGNVIIQLGN